MDRKNNIVQAKAIKKVYGRGASIVEALGAVNVIARPGEFLGIMGPSGSGKSTLLHILGCLDSPSSGSYLFAGQDVSCLSDYELSLIRANKIGFVFQAFNLIPQINVFESVLMPFIYQKQSPPDMHIKAKRAVEQVGLIQRIDHKTTELSRGEMQRVAIARALVIEPLLLLTDEPTGNLDSKTSEHILSLICEVNRKGTTVIMVTHDERVASHCHRVIYIDDGKIIEDA
jgi:putative ABC transport system ATP-binding protein